MRRERTKEEIILQWAKDLRGLADREFNEHSYQNRTLYTCAEIIENLSYKLELAKEENLALKQELESYARTCRNESKDGS